MSLATQEETIKISKKLHDALKEEKKISRIPMKYLLEKAFELYKKQQEVQR